MAEELNYLGEQQKEIQKTDTYTGKQGLRCVFCGEEESVTAQTLIAFI